MALQLPRFLRRASAESTKYEPRIIPLGDDADEALLVLAGGYGAALARYGGYAHRAIAEEVRAASGALAAAVAAALVGEPGAQPPGALREAADAYRALLAGAYGEGVFRTFPKSLRHVRESHLLPCASAVREKALEYHDCELLLGRRENRVVAATWPASPAQAHVWLLGALYERVEGWIEDSGPLALEREASRWFFERWRSAQAQRGDDFARGVREQEFSLVERDIIMLGASAMEHVVAADLLDDAGPKQRRMAASLPGSRCGAWEVAHRSGAWVELRHPLGGAPLRVAEHAEEIPYGAGDVVMGRLIPFGDGTWLRSPGAVLLPGMPRGFAADFAGRIERMADEMPYQVVVEAALHAACGVRGLPRAVRPRASPNEAAEILRVLREALTAAGAAERVAPEEAPPELAGVPDTEIYRYAVDEVLNDYVGALLKVAKKSRPVREMLRRRERARKQGGG